MSDVPDCLDGFHTDSHLLLHFDAASLDDDLRRAQDEGNHQDVESHNCVNRSVRCDREQESFDCRFWRDALRRDREVQYTGRVLRGGEQFW